MDVIQFIADPSHDFVGHSIDYLQVCAISIALAIVIGVVLGIPPILLNTYTGIRGIDPATIDAAKGMGMTTWQIISRIQTPLVLPILAAGIRTSSVQIIATA